jgi:hypothetical protein
LERLNLFHAIGSRLQRRKPAATRARHVQNNNANEIALMARSYSGEQSAGMGYSTRGGRAVGPLPSQKLLMHFRAELSVVLKGLHVRDGFAQAFLRKSKA